jgi:periplasmic protein TonB
MVMDYARQQRDPTRHLIGIAFVVLLHALILYALVTGLARKAIEVIKKPLDATIIQEIKLPPPPPPPPKRVEVPKVPDTYIPPPDVPVSSAVATGPTITAVTVTPPPAAPVVAPPVVAPPPPPPPKPAVRRGGQLEIVERENPTFPKEAIRAGVEKGVVVARMQIDEKGHVTEVQIVSSDPPRVFDREVRRALSMWRFKADGEKYVGEIEISFKLAD